MEIDKQGARLLAKSFSQAAFEINDFLDRQYGKISHAEYEAVSESGKTLIRVASFCRTEAVGLSIDDMNDPAAELKSVIENAQGSIKSLNDARKCIRIAAGLADLASSIITKDPGAAFKGAKSMKELFDG